MGRWTLFCASRPVPEDFSIRPVVTGRIFRLPESKRKDMISSWTKIPDKESLGQDIFRYIFMSKPSLKEVWGIDTESVEDLSGNPLFQKHSGNFVTFLALAIRDLSLDGTDGAYMINMARSLGKQHASFK